MKKMTAWVMALVALLAWTTACAESSGTRIRLTKMRVSYVRSEDEYVRLHHMKFYMYVGSAEGVPTLQLTLDYGDEQQLDSVFQVVGSQLVMCVGGINGTYYVDLNELFDEPGKGLMMATALGAALQMFGSNPDAVIQAMMPEDEKGYHQLRFELPVERCLVQVDRLMGEQGDAGGAQLSMLREFLEGVAGSEQPVELMIRYRPEKKRVRLYLLCGDDGIELYAHTKQTTGDMELINISADEDKRNLLDMDQATKDELIGELEFLGIKMGSFVRNTNLSRLTDEPAS